MEYETIYRLGVDEEEAILVDGIRLSYTRNDHQFPLMEIDADPGRYKLVRETDDESEETIMEEWKRFDDDKRKKLKRAKKNGYEYTHSRFDDEVNDDE